MQLHVSVAYEKSAPKSIQTPVTRHFLLYPIGENLGGFCPRASEKDVWLYDQYLEGHLSILLNLPP